MGAPHDELRALLSAEILPAHRARWGASNGWDALVDFQRALGARGWTAPGWPVELGGRGLDVDEQVACERVFHELDAPMRVAVFGVNNVGPTIAAWATPEQRRHLHAIVAVEELWCQGFSEPDAGSDLAGLRTRADVDGDDFVVNGHKVWTSIGVHATHCMLLVRTNPRAAKHRGVSALLVPLDLPGVTRRAIAQIDGGDDFAELFFDDVRVPRSSLLGPLDEGWRVTMTTLGHERAGVLAIAGQLAADADRIVRDLAGDGRLSGAWRDRAMDVWVRARLLGVTGERSLVAGGAGDGAGGGPGALSTLIKLAWSDVAQRLDELAVDAVGLAAVAGEGDLPVARRLLRSRSLSIAGGTTEVLRNLVGERVLGLPKEPT